MKPKELAIIGAGIAGVSAAVYAKRAGLDFHLFESKGIGGQLLLMENIDNYVGLSAGTKGGSLAQTLAQTLDDLHIPIQEEEITEIMRNENGLTLRSSKDTYSVQTAIVATGASFRKLNIQGEGQFTGKGVSYCAVCDGFFFRNKEVAVVGGGNTAAEEALYLSDIAKKVTLIHRRDTLRALDYLQEQLSKKNNIEICYNSVVEEIKGAELLQELILRDVKTNTMRTVPLQGLFVAIGLTPHADSVKNLVSVDEQGFIITDEYMQTSVDCLWACGDCRRRPLKQLITAASEGAVAALSAYKHLKGHYIST